MNVTQCDNCGKVGRSDDVPIGWVRITPGDPKPIAMPDEVDACSPACAFLLVASIYDVDNIALETHEAAGR